MFNQRCVGKNKPPGEDQQKITNQPNHHPHHGTSNHLGLTIANPHSHPNQHYYYIFVSYEEFVPSFLARPLGHHFLKRCFTSAAMARISTAAMSSRKITISHIIPPIMASPIICA